MSEDPKIPDSSTEPSAIPDSAAESSAGATGQTAAEVTAEQIEKPLIEDVSADVAPVVQEFIAEAAAANVEQDVAIAAETPSEQSGVGFAAGEAEEVAPYIAFENVNKSFGDVVVLKDVSFYVKPGETLCILGRSGVGKSVSLQILMGFFSKAGQRHGVGCGAGYCGVYRA